MIQNAWQKSGISIDENGQPKATPEVFTWNGYAPSISGSTKLHLPPGYPGILIKGQPTSSTNPDSDSDSDSDSDLDSDSDSDSSDSSEGLGTDTDNGASSQPHHSG